MTLFIGELVKGTKDGKPAVKEKRTTCFNCQSKTHYTRECTEPCKYCNSNGQIHFQCEQYKKNKESNGIKGRKEAMLIEEVLLSEKRKKVTIDAPKEPYTNRNVRALRFGRETPTPGIKRIKSNEVIVNEDIVMKDSTGSSAVVDVDATV